MAAFAAPLALPRNRGQWTSTCCALSLRTPRMVTSPEAPEQPTARLRPGEMAVRFTNTPDGADIVVGAKPGDILLSVGDNAGVHIPRACVSGLCGSCTCDIVDASQPNGLQTVRACQTSVLDIDGTQEMVVDLARMRETRSRRKSDPMARFTNMDTEYKAGAQPIRAGSGLRREMECAACSSLGDVECYSCDGSGQQDAGLDENVICLLCSGSGQLRCADCQGMGVIKVR